MTTLYKSLRISHFTVLRRPTITPKFCSRTFTPPTTPRFISMANIPNLKLNDGREIPVVCLLVAPETWIKELTLPSLAMVLERPIISQTQTRLLTKTW